MVLYNTSCLDISRTHTPDPWITYSPHTHKFYLTHTGNDRIPMWDARSLMDFYTHPNRGPVYMASPNGGPQSERLWAPELHALRGRWYIYFAGADKAVGNRSHRMYVLGGPPAEEDPHAGPWELLGPIRGMDMGQWAIDGTVFEVGGELYFCYSGWPRKETSPTGWEGRDESLQQLFLIRLADPVTACSEALMISHPSQAWERLGERGPAINEGPQWLESPTGQWRGIVYSCSASWTKEYKMATLQYLGGGRDPLNPESWRKSEKPLIQNREDGIGPYGPGHGCFLHGADGETVALFHATDRETDGNHNRRCRMQRVRWTPAGPDMGGYVGASTKDVDVFLQGCREEGQENEIGGLRGLVHAVKGV
ncbi:Arabinanase/levansucrase/invertase [Hortaea werneckii]|nr:Arabinanase/levansucrase/invertase [Hortaea werneckii]